MRPTRNDVCETENDNATFFILFTCVNNTFRLKTHRHKGTYGSTVLRG